VHNYIKAIYYFFLIRKAWGPPGIIIIKECVKSGP